MTDQQPRRSDQQPRRSVQQPRRNDQEPRRSDQEQRRNVQQRQGARRPEQGAAETAKRRQMRMARRRAQRRRLIIQMSAALVFLILVIILLALGVTGRLTGTNRNVTQGLVQLEEGNPSGAALLFKQAIAANRNLDMAYRGLGMARFQEGEFPGALESFNAAITNGAIETPTMRNMMGIASMNLGDYAQAIAFFEQGIQLATEFPDEDFTPVLREMRHNIVVCHQKMFNWSAARTAAESFLALYPDDLDMQRELEFLQTR